MIVPASRAEAKGWRVVTWALFGNDEGGLYGERDNWSYLPGNSEKTLWTQVRWWARNPLHNLFWHVINIPRDMAFVLYDSELDDVLFYRAPKQWLPGSHFQIALAPFYVGWRTTRGGGWQGYFGWRDPQGLLGWSPLKRWRA